MNICFLVVNCLHIVHFIQQKIGLIIIEVKAVWKFCKDLREQVMKIINHEKRKEMIPSTNKENKLYRDQKVCHICKKII